MKVPDRQFAICLDNTGNEASLILGKVYQIRPDERAAEEGLVRIIDETGEDYLFDEAQFAVVRFPNIDVERFAALRTAAGTQPNEWSVGGQFWETASRAYRNALVGDHAGPSGGVEPLPR